MQADTVRSLVKEASDQLEQARTHYSATPRAHRAMARHSLAAIEGSFRAFLTWNSVAPSEETSVRDLGGRSSNLNNVFRLPADLAPTFAAKLSSTSEEGDLDIETREQLERGYHIARTTYRLLLENLPKAVIPQDLLREG